MAQAARGLPSPPPLPEAKSRTEVNASGVSWAAVIASAFVGASLSLIMLALGAGLGLSSISPWTNSGLSASTVSKTAIAWLILVQIVASAIAGYLAGRLRTKWPSIHSDEVFFRDTAHGLLTWAVGIVVTAAFLGTAASAMIGGITTNSIPAATSDFAGSTSGQLSSGSPNAYFVDTLLRSERPTTDANDAELRAEVERIFANGIAHGSLSAADSAYLAQLVSMRTGVDQSEAERRVSYTFMAAQQTADEARRVAAHFSYWLFLSLLIGAFCASYAATLGGRQRDGVKLI